MRLALLPRFVCLFVALPLIAPPGAASQTPGEPLAPPALTTIYIVRHGEKLNDTPDTPLSQAGKNRALALAHVLKDAEITAVFVSNFQRTRQTAKPLAAARGLTPIQYPATTPQAAVAQILANHGGGRILVVAHSTTVDEIASGLGAAGVNELAETQFDRLFVVQRLGGHALLLRLRYGKETP